jgi:hypothetical protein
MQSTKEKVEFQKKITQYVHNTHRELTQIINMVNRENMGDRASYVFDEDYAARLHKISTQLNSQLNDMITILNEIQKV